MVERTEVVVEDDVVADDKVVVDDSSPVVDDCSPVVDGREVVPSPAASDVEEFWPSEVLPGLVAPVAPVVAVVGTVAGAVEAVRDVCTVELAPASFCVPRVRSTASATTIASRTTPPKDADNRRSFRPRSRLAWKRWISSLVSLSLEGGLAVNRGPSDRPQARHRVRVACPRA